LSHGSEFAAPAGSTAKPSCPHPLESKHRSLLMLLESIVTRRTVGIGAFEDCWAEFFRGL
jgi:hypothetical protein